MKKILIQIGRLIFIINHKEVEQIFNKHNWNAFQKGDKIFNDLFSWKSLDNCGEFDNQSDEHVLIKYDPTLAAELNNILPYVIAWRV